MNVLIYFFVKSWNNNILTVISSAEDFIYILKYRFIGTMASPFEEICEVEKKWKTN